jgi:hypothetical protein
MLLAKLCHHNIKRANCEFVAGIAPGKRYVNNIII